MASAHLHCCSPPCIPEVLEQALDRHLSTECDCMLQSVDEDGGGKGSEALPTVTLSNPRNLPSAVVAAEAMSGLPEPLTIPTSNLPRSLPMPYLQETCQSRFAEYMRQPCVTDVRFPPSLSTWQYLRTLAAHCRPP